MGSAPQRGTTQNFWVLLFCHDRLDSIWGAEPIQNGFRMGTCDLSSLALLFGQVLFGNIYAFFIGPRSPGPIYVSGLSVTDWATFVNLTDVTLTDEDTNSILTDNTNRAIQDNVAMQVTQPGGQVCNLCKWATWSGATWWPILELIKVTWLKLKWCNSGLWPQSSPT
jgi:hypothetical protein